MLAVPETAPSAARSAASGPLSATRAEARAARLKRFEREQFVVDCLNRGLSMSEIASKIGVGDKRMRAIVSETVARRAPHASAEFIAIQVGRLNEALLVAFSAMTDLNLRAVDRVVRIVRELDRYHGLNAISLRRPIAPLEGDAEGRAWLDRSPEIPAEALENADSAPGNSERFDAAATVAAGARPVRSDRPSPRGGGPENPPQPLESARFTPGFSQAPETLVATPDAAQRPASGDAAAAQARRVPRRARQGGPEIRSQPLESARFTPGFLQLLEAFATDPSLALGPSPRAAVVDRGGAGSRSRLDAGPEMPAQAFENARFAPGFGAAVAARSCEPAPPAP